MNHVASFYKFVELEDTRNLQAELRAGARERGLLGTILLAPEGINGSLAGSLDQLDAFLADLRSDRRFSDLTAKISVALRQPFRRLEVKCKRWIIRFAEASDPRVQEIQTAPRLSPAAVRDLMSTRDPDVIVVDTRNDYETEAGAFVGAVRLPIRNFTEFPSAFEEKFETAKDKTFIFYCTGGVRCEKVVPWALKRGFKGATQLDGGILGYFAAEGTANYEGQCFVFDDRWQLDGSLADFPGRPGEPHRPPPSPRL